jgi:hypothetical protein
MLVTHRGENLREAGFGLAPIRPEGVHAGCHRLAAAASVGLDTEPIAEDGGEFVAGEQAAGRLFPGSDIALAHPADGNWWLRRLRANNAIASDAPKSAVGLLEDAGCYHGLHPAEMVQVISPLPNSKKVASGAPPQDGAAVLHHTALLIPSP